MIGLIPGKPSRVSGGGGFPRITALCTRVASQAKRTVVPTIVSATRRIATSPKIRQKRLGRASRSIRFRPRTVFHMRKGPAGGGGGGNPPRSHNPRRFQGDSPRGPKAIPPAAAKK